MKERCVNCKGLEQEIYWKHFQSMQFCQFLAEDFNSQLIPNSFACNLQRMIPGKFSENLREKLGKKLGLRGPSGTTWDVQLVENGDLLYIGGGWEGFVDAHSLSEKDILVFKYTGNSQFDVLMFEGSNLCEKESSYFVRKCGHTKQPEDEIIKPAILKDCSVEIIQEHSPVNLVSNSAENAGKGTVAAEYETADTLQKRNPHFNDKENGKKEAYDHEPEITCLEEEFSQNPSPIWEPVKLPCSKQMPMKEGKSTTNYHLCYTSNRRPVTEAEKVAALRSASKELSEGSFLVAMRSTHVNKRFYLNLPSEWAMMHIVQERQDVILHTRGRSWKTTLIFNAAGRGGLSRGWRDFAIDNNLEEGDVCVFKLTSQKPTPVVLEVSIFRVVPESAAPTRLSNEPSSSQGASALNKRKSTEMGNDVDDDI